MDIINDKMGAAGSLVVAITAHGVDHERSWPFVALSSFQERAASVKRLSGALYIGINPLVKDEVRGEWEFYSNFEKDAEWYQEGREYQKLQGFDGLDNRPQVETDDPDLFCAGFDPSGLCHPGRGRCNGCLRCNRPVNRLSEIHLPQLL